MRPEGDQREDVLDAARKVLRTDDPEAKIHELIDKGLAESDRDPKATYKDDIAPWLGEKAGVWVAGVDRKEPGYVVLIAAKDTEKAQEAIDKGVKSDGGKVKERSYSGVDYQVDDDGRGGRDRRRLLHGRDRGGVQAHGQGAGRRLARRGRSATRARSTSSRTTGIGSSTSTSSRSSSRR